MMIILKSQSKLPQSSVALQFNKECNLFFPEFVAFQKTILILNVFLSFLLKIYLLFQVLLTSHVC